MATSDRLLILAVDFLPHIGGISIMTHHLANAFSKNGLETMVVAPTAGQVPDGMNQEYKFLEDKRAHRTVREGKWARREDKRIFALLDSIRNAFVYDRVLLAHPFYYGLGALQHARQRRIPLSALFYGFELRSQLLRRIPLTERLENAVRCTPNLRDRTLKIIRQADQLLPISNYTADLLRSAGTRRPIYVTGCGITSRDIEREISRTPYYDRSQKQALRAQLGLQSNPTIGFVGRLVDSKNVDFLLQVTSRLRELHAVVVGMGPEAEKLKATAKQYGIAERVHWIGSVEEDVKWSYLRALDAFCLFSKEMPQGQVEGFGIVLLEASAAGTPVIACRSGGMVDVVADGQNGFLCGVDDVSEATEKLGRLLSSPLLARNFVESARAQITDRFNWNKIASSIMSSWKSPPASVRSQMALAANKP